MRVPYLAAVIVEIAVALGACASLPEPANPHEFLDETTAATVSVVAKPLVFAHERPELAAHTRDYVTLAAASVDRGGAIEYFVFAYFWSTLDNRTRNGVAPVPDNLTIAADDRRIEPQLAGHSSQEAGVGSAVRAPPGRHWTLNVYRTDVATLRFIAEARHLTVIAGSEKAQVTHELWEDQRRALRGLVRQAAPP
jgi:hypothetical protein